MIEWLYMLTAVLFFGIANFRRKGFMAKATPSEAPFWETLGFIPAILLVFIITPFVFTLDFLFLSFISAVLAVGAMYLFFLALTDGSVSAVTTIANLNTHIAALMAFIVFSEAFSGRLLLGIFMAAGVIILFNQSKALKPGKWLFYSLLSLGFFAGKNLVDKALSVSYDPMLSFAVVSVLAMVLYVFPLMAGKRKANTNIKLRIMSNGILVSIAFAALYFAYNLVPVSIAAPVIGMNLVVTVLLSAFLLHEKLDRRAWIAIALAILSVWLLAG